MQPIQLANATYHKPAFVILVIDKRFHQKKINETQITKDSNCYIFENMRFFKFNVKNNLR